MTDILQQKKYQVSVLIRIPSSNPSPANAIGSVVNNAAHVCDLHLEQMGYASEVVLNYPDAKKDQEALEKAGISITWHASFDPSKLQTQALIRLEPDVKVTESAFKQVKQDMVDNPQCQHFTLSSILYLNTPRFSWWELPWYGFLFPLLVVDSLANLVTLWQHARTVDMRAQLVQSTWPCRSRLATKSWWRWWVRTGTQWTRPGGVSCVQMPLVQKDRGLSLVLRTVKQHAHLSIWRPWWVALFLVYYSLCALPWWTLFLGVHQDISQGFLSWLFLRPVFADSFWFAVQLLHIALVVYATWGEIELPANWEGVAIVLYPVYLTLAPAFFLYGRWYSSRSVLSEVAKLHQLRQQQKIQ
jgi:hypothetical protein